MGTVWQDVHFAGRMLMRSPGFTFVVILILTLGIGANTAIFSIVNGVLLKPLPFEDPARIVQVLTRFPGEEEVLPDNSTADFAEVQKRNHVFTEMAALKSQALVDIGRPEPRRVVGAQVSPDFFHLLGVQPMLGRTFRREEHRPGEDHVLVLSHPYWTQRCGADPNIIGRTITFKEGAYTVAGVMSPGFQFLDPRDVWKPLVLTAGETGAAGRNAFEALVIARLKPGVARGAAQAELDLIGNQLAQQYPKSTARRFLLAPLHERMVANVRFVLWVLLGAVGFVLLIACANVSSMLLARSIGRRREIAIRTALGARRLRLIRQFLTESLLLSLTGGLCAMGLIGFSLRLIRTSLPAGMPRVHEIQIDSRVFSFALLASFLTGAMITLVPLLQIPGMGKEGVWREGRLGLHGRSHREFPHKIFLVSEMALSLMLLVGAGLMIRSLGRLTSVDLGLDPENVLTTDLTPNESVFSRPQGYYHALADRVKQLPGVQSVAYGGLRLFGSACLNLFEIPGREVSHDGKPATADFVDISADYFATLRIPVLEGRSFTEGDHAEAETVAIVNQTFARRYFPDISAVGQTLTWYGNPARIVGVVSDVHPNGFRSEVMPTIYCPYPQAQWGKAHWGSSGIRLIVRTYRSPESLAQYIRRELLALSPSSPIGQVATIKEMLSAQVAPMRFNTRLLSLFAALALVLASLGLYGLMAFFASQRTQEIGVRMALGARSADVLRSIVGQGLKLALIGMGFGLTGAFGLTRIIASLLYDVSPMDPLTLVFVSLILIGVAALASYLPARRAARIDPIAALRYE
jgi:putative ABC transport system permease protein